MLTAVLVDDEVLERDGIKSLISWVDLGIKLVGEASGATKALELIKKTKPNILITDIKMPGESGIELVAKVKQFLPDINVVFVSGYQDFVYAKNAISLDAYGYVLKPVDKNELVEVLNKIVRHESESDIIAAEKQELKHQFEESISLLQEKFLNDILSYESRYEQSQLLEKCERLKLPFEKGSFFVAVISFDTGCDDIDLIPIITQKRKETDHSNRITERVIRQESFYAIIINDKDNYYGTGFSLKNELDILVKHLSETYNTAFTIGLSSAGGCLGEVGLLYDNAKQAINAKWYLGKGIVIQTADLDKCENNEKTEKSEYFGHEVENALNKDINIGDDIHIEAFVTQFFGNMSWEEKKNPQLVRDYCLDLLNISEYILGKHGEMLSNIFGNKVDLFDELLNIDTLTEVESWMIDKFVAVARYMAKKKNEHNSVIIDKILEIIENEYAGELTVEKFAKEVFLSPNYVRRIFKKEIGTTILEYITETRMNKAIELMRHSFLNMAEIASKVGYKNPSYFGQIFKKKYGITPGEYRNSAGKS